MSKDNHCSPSRYNDTGDCVNYRYEETHQALDASIRTARFLPSIVVAAEGPIED